MEIHKKYISVICLSKIDQIKLIANDQSRENTIIWIILEANAYEANPMCTANGQYPLTINLARAKLVVIRKVWIRLKERLYLTETNFCEILVEEMYKTQNDHYRWSSEAKGNHPRVLIYHPIENEVNLALRQGRSLATHAHINTHTHTHAHTERGDTANII